ncbi:MAG: response regulator transcription factor [Chitinophagales bacterium]|nr:response regulator transcription factor [Chitinophagales bacterium]
MQQNKNKSINKPIRAVIVDDSMQARKLLRLMLHEIANDLEVVGEASNADEGLQSILQCQPDVVFLDIEMPGKSGLQLVEDLSRNEVSFEIVFTTAYNEHAIRAFRLSALDYLLKPIHEKQLLEAIEKVRKSKILVNSRQQLQQMLRNLADDKEATLCVPVLNGYVFIKIADLLYVKADGSYAQLVVKGKQPMVVSRNLKYFEQALEHYPNFIRVHRSYLINLHQMKRFDKANRGTIIMNDDATIDLARERRDDFFRAIGQ